MNLYTFVPGFPSFVRFIHTAGRHCNLFVDITV